MRQQFWTGPAIGLALALALGACADESTGSSTSSGYPLASSMFWGGPVPGSPGDGLTVARVEGTAAAPAPLAWEEGKTWPDAEPPRTTLANPDEALRGIPNYRPGDATPVPERRVRRGSSTPPDMLSNPNLPPPMLSSPAPTQPVVAPPSPRTEGQVIQTPQGPVVSSGGTDRIQTYNAPGGGTGIITRDGSTTIITRPDGSVQQIPTSR